MDCEGEEYHIFKDLDESGLIKNFHFVMLEWHYSGAEYIIDILEKMDFHVSHFKNACVRKWDLYMRGKIKMAFMGNGR